MPDGDSIHTHLGRNFRSSYRLVCDNDQPAAFIADQIGKDLKKALKRFGNPPITHICMCADRLCDTLKWEADLDPIECLHFIQDQARNLNGHRRGMALAIDSSKILLMDLIDKHPLSDATLEVVCIYIRRLLRAEFFEHIPQTFVADRVPVDVFEQRICTLQPLINHHVGNIAAQIARTRSVDRIRLIPCSVPPETFENFDLSKA